MGNRLHVVWKGLAVIKMVDEDSGNLDIGSDHNLILGEVVCRRTEVEVRRKRYKWMGMLSGSSLRVHRVGEGGESDG